MDVEAFDKEESSDEDSADEDDDSEFDVCILMEIASRCTSIPSHHVILLGSVVSVL